MEPGSKVPGSIAIVVAIFVNGRYPDHGSGNDAAFYLGQDAGGIEVMDHIWFTCRYEQ